jgi:hypothetical protein
LVQRHTLLFARTKRKDSVDSFSADDGRHRQAHFPQPHALGKDGRHREDCVFIAQDGRRDSSQRRADPVAGRSFGPRDLRASAAGAVGEITVPRPAS